jgi:hypothetical protein
MDFVRDIQSYMTNDCIYYKNKEGKCVEKSKHMELHVECIRDVKSAIREVKYADSFECPENLRANLDVIIEKIHNGSSLKDHIPTSSQYDLMRDEWQIRHLHIHVPHQDDLLFCMITDDTVYAIAIGHHRQWENDVFYKTAYKNWPELFEEHKGITPPNSTQKQRKTLRKRGINSFTNVDGKSITPKSPFGFTASKHPLEAFLKTAHDFDVLRNIKQNTDALTEGAKVYIQKMLENNQINAIEIDVVLEITVEEGSLSLYFLCTTDSCEKYRILFDLRDVVFSH